MTATHARPDAPAGPPADEVLDVVRDALSLVLEVPGDAVQLRSRLADDLAADSLALVEVAEIVEQRLSARTASAVRIEDRALAAFRTVGDAVGYLRARLP